MDTLGPRPSLLPFPHSLSTPLPPPLTSTASQACCNLLWRKATSTWDIAFLTGGVSAGNTRLRIAGRGTTSSPSVSCSSALRTGKFQKSPVMDIPKAQRPDSPSPAGVPPAVSEICCAGRQSREDKSDEWA